MREILVVSQIAAAFVLTIAAGLLIESFSRLRRVDIGFDAADLLTFHVSNPGYIVSGPKTTASTVERILDRIRTFPSVIDAAAVTALPFSNTDLRAEVRSTDASLNAPVTATPVRFATSGYFRTLSANILEGRAFVDSRTDMRPTVAVINVSMKRRLWPYEGAVGKRLSVLGASVEVVGVIDDIRHGGLRASVDPETFVPITDAIPLSLFIVVRTQGRPLQIVPDVRAAVRSVDRNLVMSSVATMEQRITDSVADPWLYLGWMTGFALMALGLSCAGIYGVMSHAAHARRAEVGIRLALGGRPADIVWAMMKRAVVLTSVGISVGLTAAAGSTRVLSSLLFETSTLDMRTFEIVSAVIIATALSAALIPAYRAARLDPVESLRYE